MTADERARTPSPEGLLDGAEARVARVELERDLAAPEGPDEGPWPALRKLGSALATFAALVVASYLIPLPWAQPWRADEDYLPFWNVIGRELLGQGAQLGAELEAVAEIDALAERLDSEEPAPVVERAVIERAPPSQLRFASYEPHPLDPRPEEVVVALEHAEALDAFYTALTLTDIGYASALTRAGHWGDSVIGNDGITAAIRRRMQARFGDAGHGFHALAKYDSSYRHKGVEFEMLGDVRWRICAIRNRCKDDGHYGYGGVTVWSPGGAGSRFATARKGVGQKVSRFELYYARQPRGGELRVYVDGVEHRVDTRGEGPGLEDAWASFELDDGPHAFEIRAKGKGEVRAYGVVLERARPGVVWDGMALIGAFTKRLAEQERGHLARQLGHRELDLIVLSFGGNDMTRERSDLRSSLAPYEADYAEVLDAMLGAAPGVSCLIVGPVDHGERVDGRVLSRPIVARMSEAQRRVAAAHGCAFFDTLAAMGGPGSVARWRARSLMSPDLSHPSPRGHEVLGAMIYAALVQGYVEFRRRHVGELVGVEATPPGPLREPERAPR